MFIIVIETHLIELFRNSWQSDFHELFTPEHYFITITIDGAYSIALFMFTVELEYI